MHHNSAPLNVPSFLSALAQLASVATPPSRPASPVVEGPRTPPEPLRITVPPLAMSTATGPGSAKAYTFSTLESPSTPSDRMLRPPLELTSSPSPVGTVSSRSLFGSPDRHVPMLLPPIDSYPITPRSNRLSAFSTVHTPPPKSTAALGPGTRGAIASRAAAASAFDVPLKSASSVVAAQVQGMGRVALSRRVLVDQLGSESAEQAIAAAAASAQSSPPSLLFGTTSSSEPSTTATSVDAFQSSSIYDSTRASSTAHRLKRGGGKAGAQLVDERLGRVWSWLESDDEDDDEAAELDREQTWLAAPSAWEEELADEEREKLRVTRLDEGVDIEYVDIEESDVEDGPAEAVSQVDEATVVPEGNRRSSRRRRVASRAAAAAAAATPEPTPVAPPAAASPVEAVVRVQVGGKNIRPLLLTKRKRLAEQEDQDSSTADRQGDLLDATEDEQSNADVDEVPLNLSDVFGDHSESQRSNGKMRAPGDVVDCVCERVDDGEPMIRCDECHIWLHLACLNIPSSRRVPKRWICFRCSGEEAPLPRSPAKRFKLASARRNTTDGAVPSTPPNMPSTPILSREPTLVATSSSLGQDHSFYRAGAPDMALAPSPRTSPALVRRHTTNTMPTSPVQANLVPIPVTPKFDSSARAADYSPRSPLFYRAGRVRVASGLYEEGGAWVSSWDGHVFGNAHHASQPQQVLHHHHHHHSHSTMLGADDDAWHDLTKTPSRTVSSSFGWETPSRRAMAASMMGDTPTRTDSRTTASQDFLSALHRDDEVSHHSSGTGSGGGHSRMPSYAQRLFGSPAATHAQPTGTASSLSPYQQHYQATNSPSAASTHLAPPVLSPLNPRNAALPSAQGQGHNHGTSALWAQRRREHSASATSALLGAATMQHHSPLALHQHHHHQHQQYQQHVRRPSSSSYSIVTPPPASAPVASLSPGKMINTKRGATGSDRPRASLGAGSDGTASLESEFRESQRQAGTGSR